VECGESVMIFGVAESWIFQKLVYSVNQRVYRLLFML